MITTTGCLSLWVGSKDRVVIQKDIAAMSLLIPTIHRIDCFWELRATTFVDATGIDPNILKLIHIRLMTTVLNFGIACFLRAISSAHILKCHFPDPPSMWQNRIWRYKLILELLKLFCMYIYQSHRCAVVMLPTNWGEGTGGCSFQLLRLSRPATASVLRRKRPIRMRKNYNSWWKIENQW